MKKKDKNLILGTALWGWGINKKDAFSILDKYIEYGGRYVDCATNYPINGITEDYGLALKWLTEWISINSTKLFVIVKIGSIDNLGSPSYDLSNSRLLSLYEDLKQNFGESLGCISIHWDNRSEDKYFDFVKSTVFALQELRNKGISIGLSGIKCPQFYADAAPKLINDWIIQCKENFLTQESRQNYQQFFPNAQYYAYGINMGGFKISEDEQSVSAKIRKISYPNRLKDIMGNSLRDKVVQDLGLENINDLNMAFIFINPIYSGIIIGPRTEDQMSLTFKSWQRLINLDLSELTKLKIFINELQRKIKSFE